MNDQPPLQQLRQIRELRAEIERFAARHAARRIRQNAVSAEPLHRAYAALVDACIQEDANRIADRDRAFHLTLLELADVPGLQEAWLPVHEREHGFWRSSLRNDWPHLMDLAEIHRPLLEQVAAGNEKGAEDAMLLHLELIWYRLSGEDAAPGDPIDVACAYLRLHLSESVTLSYLATHVCLISVSHLVRLFRERLGMSFTAYLRKLRLTRAAELMRHSDLSIKAIAASVGYRDPSRFTEHFKAMYGDTPSTWRC